MQILARRGIQIGAHIRSIGQTEDRPFHPLGEMPETLEAVRLAPFPVLDETAGGQMQAAILEARAAGDSIGGIIECMAIGLPAGVGNPMFQGAGEPAGCCPVCRSCRQGGGVRLRFCVGRNEGLGAQRSLYHGGWNRPYPDQSRRRHPGGISNGMPLVFRTAFKPTPSIALNQRTVHLSTGAGEDLQISGRHDPVLSPGLSRWWKL